MWIEPCQKGDGFSAILSISIFNELSSSAELQDGDDVSLWSSSLAGLCPCIQELVSYIRGPCPQTFSPEDKYM